MQGGDAQIISGTKGTLLISKSNISQTRSILPNCLISVVNVSCPSSLATLENEQDPANSSRILIVNPYFCSTFIKYFTPSVSVIGISH